MLMAGHPHPIIKTDVSPLLPNEKTAFFERGKVLYGRGHALVCPSMTAIQYTFANKLNNYIRYKTIIKIIVTDNKKGKAGAGTRG